MHPRLHREAAQMFYVWSEPYPDLLYENREGFDETVLMHKLF